MSSSRELRSGNPEHAAAPLERDLDSAHPVIRRGYAVWHALRPAPDRLPGRQHIRPRDMPDLLPYAWLLDVAEPLRPGEPPRLRYRLIGGHAGTMPGLAAGRWLDEIEPDFPHDPALHGPYVAAIRDGHVDYFSGSPRFSACLLASRIERLLLPLARDGGKVDMLFGFTVFFGSNGQEMPTVL